ncbi:MAG: helicase-associated domain-containing protein, partial [Planctomycetaceae bacterium]
AGLIAERLAEPRTVEPVVARRSPGARMALSLFALTETAAWPMLGLAHALRCLGVDPVPAVRELAATGLAAVAARGGGEPVPDPARRVEVEPARTLLRAHPAALAAARTILPEGEPLPRAGPVRQVREADGLEPILRLAAVWQRVAEAPLRQTQQGTIYKRDRERLEDDPALAGPIADALEPLPDMAAFWLALARGVGLLEAEPGSDRLIAAPPAFWAEGAIHLPQMIAVGWLALRTWHEQAGMQQEGSAAELAWPYVRPAVLLWLATPPDDAWVALDDLAGHLRARAPDWERASFLVEVPAPAGPRGRPARARADGRDRPAEPGAGALESLLLGAAYQLGLVRTAEEDPSGRRVVQLTRLGRYILALGPPAPPRPTLEYFLFVQPNFEVIAYRQGLTPTLIGQFSRFARWSQVGAALELRLTPESVYRGLEGGLTPEAILDRLARHSPRPLPAGVAEAVRTWAGRRDRVTYYASATLIEFASREDREQGLAHWPATGPSAPVPISDRFLLVEDESAIPFRRFRLAGSRDYRRAPESCLEVESDGVTLTLDLARSDLLVDAELARFADEQPPVPGCGGAPANPRRRFVVSAASLARAAETGLSTATLAHWYVRRTGAEMPPAVRLLLLAAASKVPPLETSRPILLHTRSAELLDGLVQHPATGIHLGTRLGPTTVVVPDESLEPFRRALVALGLIIKEEAGGGR